MKRKMKRVLAAIFCMTFLFSSGLVQASEKITPSTKEYDVHIENAARVFLGNEQAVEWKEGKKYFLTYTVDHVDHNKTTQSGVIATTNREDSFPYSYGGMRYRNTESVMCEEGWTYFIRFEVLKNDFKVIASKAKGNQSEYIDLPDAYNDMAVKAKYFGVWFAEGGDVTAQLSHVRCYDEKGTDLGVFGKKENGILVLEPSKLKANTTIEHSYSFTVEQASKLAFGNLRPTDSKVVYLEYTIKDVDAKNVSQAGATMTNRPTEAYPHGDDGYLKYDVYQKGEETPFLTKNASYLFRFERQDETFDIMVKRTLNGTDTYYAFRNEYNKYKKDYKYVTTWFGEEMTMKADFVNVKCYDEDGKNLAIQTNNDVSVKHYGPLEDYTECAAVYYCENNDTFITLDDECNASRRIGGKEYADTGTYFIEKAVMQLKIGKKVEKFNYTYNAFRDDEDNTYVRLKEAKVTFKSDVIDGEALYSMKTTAKGGYKVTEPDAPQMKGRTFVKWVTGSGETYDFDKVVLDNIELYAQWDGSEATIVSSIQNAVGNSPMMVAGLVCVLVVLATVAGIVLINRRKKDGTEN